MSIPARDVYRLLIEGAQDYGLILLDVSGDIVSWNTGAERLHGYTSGDAAGQSLAMLYSEADRTAGAAGSDLHEAERRGAANYKRWLSRKDGTRFWAEISLSSIRDASGRPAGFACVTRDASDEKRLEEAAERAVEQLDRFAFVVSHDLKEPLRTVKSYSDLIARRYRGRLDSDADEFIGFIGDAVNRMAQLLNDLVGYSQAGRLDKMNVVATPASNPLQWAIMNVDSVVKLAGAAITYDPLPTVAVDQMQLAQVFQHLLSNALKFRSAEPPRIHITAQPVAPATCRFAVVDNGIGIDPEFHDRVFGVFKRLHGKDVPGTGIGLSICRKIVEAHGGRIWLDSTPGTGTTVFFTLPSAE
jgi:PAS domain S-box-containing protein